MIKNPTKEDLKTLKGIVYSIKNKVDGKEYIGETIHAFTTRYWSGEWWKYTNSYLQRAAEKYGYDNFEISIIAHGIQTEEELFVIESDYIKQNKTMYPNGYNFLEKSRGKRNFSEEMRLNIAIAGSKRGSYAIKEIESGEVINYRCPKEIIDKYGVREQNLNSLFNGRLLTLKGICLPETDTNKPRKNSKLKVIFDGEGNRYEFYNMRQFEKDHGIGVGRIGGMIRNKAVCTKSKNGKLYMTEETYKNKNLLKESSYVQSKKQKYKTITLTRISDNTDFTVKPKEITEWCSKFGLVYSHVYVLTSGKQKTAKGFKLKSVEYLDSSLSTIQDGLGRMI